MVNCLEGVMELARIFGLCSLCKDVGIRTWGQLRRFKERCTDGTNDDLMNKLFNCAKWGIKYWR